MDQDRDRGGGETEEVERVEEVHGPTSRNALRISSHTSIRVTGWISQPESRGQIEIGPSGRYGR
jgi:hypothetical protein